MEIKRQQLWILTILVHVKTSAIIGLSLKARRGIEERNDENDGNAGNHGGNEGSVRNHGGYDGNTRNQGGNAGNKGWECGELGVVMREIRLRIFV